MATVDPRYAAWRSEFESLGEEGVRMMDSGSQAVPDDRIRFSRVWLKQQEEARALATSDKRDKREEETLAIAKSAKASVRYDRYIAIAAVIIATIAAHKEIKWLISSVMSLFLQVSP